MEGSGGTECSKTSPSNQNQGDQREENDDKSWPKNGESSSNSTVEENEKKPPTVRPYVRSKMPRLRWTPDLHLRFINAIERLGGQERATPKLVLQMMNIKGLSIAHVKSHLQMYRSKKIDDLGQVMADHRHLVESGDRNIYNLSQLPMLQGYNQSQGSSLRYGSESSWSTARRCLISGPCVTRSLIGEYRPAGFHGSVAADRIFGSNNIRNWAYTSNFLTGTSLFSNAESAWKGRELKEGYRLSQNHIESKPNQIEQLKPVSTQSQVKTEEHKGFNTDLNTTQEKEITKTVKRKASTCNLDLGLSLKLAPTCDGSQQTLEDDEIDSELSLSLYSPSSSKKLSRLKERQENSNNRKENARRASTLDLTI